MHALPQNLHGIGVNIDDATAESSEEGHGVDAVVAGVHDQLDPVSIEEVAHGGIALLGRREGLLRQLTERDATTACECGSST